MFKMYNFRTNLLKNIEEDINNFGVIIYSGWENPVLCKY